MDKLSPRGLDAFGLEDGQYVLDVVGGKARAWVILSEPPSVEDVIVTVIGGEPTLVFDADSTPVTTEVPS